MAWTQGEDQIKYISLIINRIKREREYLDLNVLSTAQGHHILRKRWRWEGGVGLVRDWIQVTPGDKGSGGTETLAFVSKMYNVPS